jgi:hypothetical protein
VDDTGNDADEELRLRVIGVFVMIMLDWREDVCSSFIIDAEILRVIVLVVLLLLMLLLISLVFLWWLFVLLIALVKSWDSCLLCVLRRWCVPPAVSDRLL